MFKVIWSAPLAVAVAALVTLAPVPVHAQEKLAGKAFDAAAVKDFYLEGNAIPAQKRNTVVLKGADGKRMVFGLLDTSGYSTDIQQKYAGMLILERKTSIGGAAVGTGAYGFGLQKGTPPEGPGTLVIYDVGGDKVVQVPAQWDAALPRPVPLQVLNGRLYVGRHWVDVK
ncbi:hypothetical protein TBR22_A14800 [Luteitalea sp. TBR-22]|uniref:hypothetical protein n=1 Tax=Luteitalea sp. TBR-22 TaxID=2802971 RepID=UPI001AFCBB35|nr:hypothetical protein [Luteitalea sp. TBR-22]BCS32270.1 hypothetical protein TBR22_A14800 [Luteitalea sp. TBR-22]